MECFNSLLHKLRELHDREVEGWQLKIQELSNKKGCDTKRMEELFTKNQQMKDQQRLLTENIKTLENRLRAGLCDRCTVTQEVARKRQQELEATQMQSIQHITLLMAEVSNLKKENKRLREEIRNSRAALDRGHSDHSSNTSNTAEVKPLSSPDLSSPEAVAVATNRPIKQPADGDIAVKTEPEQRTEEAEHRQWRGMNKINFQSQESSKPLPSKSWKQEPSITRIGERRVHLESRLDQLSSIIPQALLLRNPLSLRGEVNPSRHVLHAPVPCRPQPVKGSAVNLPWPLSESSNWTTASSPGTSQVGPRSPKLKQTRFPNLVPMGHHASSKKQVWGSPWQKQSPPRHPDKEPTVLFSLAGLAEKVETQNKPQEKKEIQPSKAESVSGDEVIEVHDGPLDLSDRGKSSFSQIPRDYLPLNLQTTENFQEKDVKMNPSRPESSPSPVSPHSTPSMSPVKQLEVEPKSDHNHKQVKEKEQKEEVNGKTDKNSEKKVPVLTISLRPVVVLETLNSALKKQESLSSNCKSSSMAAETGSSSEEQQEQDEEGSLSGQESNQGCKRKRASVETETDRDSDTDIIQRERRLKIRLRNEEKSPSSLSH